MGALVSRRKKTRIHVRNISTQVTECKGSNFIVSSSNEQVIKEHLVAEDLTISNVDPQDHITDDGLILTSEIHRSDNWENGSSSVDSPNQVDSGRKNTKLQKLKLKPLSRKNQVGGSVDFLNNSEDRGIQGQVTSSAQTQVSSLFRVNDSNKKVTTQSPYDPGNLDGRCDAEYVGKGRALLKPPSPFGSRSGRQDLVMPLPGRGALLLTPSRNRLRLSPRNQTRKTLNNKQVKASESKEEDELDENCNIIKEGTVLADLRNAELFGCLETDTPNCLLTKAQGDSKVDPEESWKKISQKATSNVLYDFSTPNSARRAQLSPIPQNMELQCTLEEIFQSNVPCREEGLEVSAITGTASSMSNTAQALFGHSGFWNRNVAASSAGITQVTPSGSTTQSQSLLQSGSSSTQSNQRIINVSASVQSKAEEEMNVQKGDCLRKEEVRETGEDRDVIIEGEDLVDNGEMNDIAEDTLDWNVDDRVRSPSDCRSDLSMNVSDENVGDHVDLLNNCPIDGLNSMPEEGAEARHSDTKIITTAKHSRTPPPAPPSSPPLSEESADGRNPSLSAASKKDAMAALNLKVSQRLETEEAMAEMEKKLKASVEAQMSSQLYPSDSVWMSSTQLETINETTEPEDSMDHINTPRDLQKLDDNNDKAANQVGQTQANVQSSVSNKINSDSTLIPSRTDENKKDKNSVEKQTVIPSSEKTDSKDSLRANKDNKSEGDNKFVAKLESPQGAIDEKQCKPLVSGEGEAILLIRSPEDEGAGDGQRVAVVNQQSSSELECVQSSERTALACMLDTQSKSSCQLEQLQVENSSEEHINSVTLFKDTLDGAAAEPEEKEELQQNLPHQRVNTTQTSQDEGGAATTDPQPLIRQNVLYLRESQGAETSAGARNLTTHVPNAGGAEPACPDSALVQSLPVEHGYINQQQQGSADSTGVGASEADWDIVPLHRVAGQTDLGCSAAQTLNNEPQQENEQSNQQQQPQYLDVTFFPRTTSSQLPVPAPQVPSSVEPSAPPLEVVAEKEPSREEPEIRLNAGEGEPCPDEANLYKDKEDESGLLHKEEQVPTERQGQRNSPKQKSKPSYHMIQ